MITRELKQLLSVDPAPEEDDEVEKSSSNINWDDRLRRINEWNSRTEELPPEEQGSVEPHVEEDVLLGQIQSLLGTSRSYQWLLASLRTACLVHTPRAWTLCHRLCAHTVSRSTASSCGVRPKAQSPLTPRLLCCSSESTKSFRIT